MSVPVDRLGRRMRDLRVSVTDRCNFRCPYCMPAEIYGEKFEFLAREELLSFEEIERLVRICVALGVEKLRITGGEPLLRHGIAELVARLARIGGLRERTLTTNGYLLARHARSLAQAGLDRVTVSLDGHDDATCRRMNGVEVKGQAIAIALVIASGVGTFVMSLNTLQSLQNSKEMYYERYRFAHVWSHVKRAPMSLARRIETIPGVSQVQLRVVVDVTLDVRNMTEPAIGRLIGIPERRVPILNDLHLRRGRWIEPGRRDEVLVSEAFAEANQLGPGDSLGAVLHGRWQRLSIVGVALSPEYIYEIQGSDIVDKS